MSDSWLDDRVNPLLDRYQKLRDELRNRDVCHSALAIVVTTRGNIRSASASLHVEPKGRAAVAAAKSKPGELSAQLKVAREKVVEVSRIVGARGLVNDVKKLNVTFLGTELGPEERKKQLDDVARTLNDVAGVRTSSRRTGSRRRSAGFRSISVPTMRSHAPGEDHERRPDRESAQSRRVRRDVVVRNPCAQLMAGLWVFVWLSARR